MSDIKKPNGRVVTCSIQVVVYDEPITIKTRAGESKIKAEVLGCNTMMSNEEINGVKTGKMLFRTSVPLTDIATGERIVNLPLSGKNIFAPRGPRKVDDGVTAVAAVAGAATEKF